MSEMYMPTSYLHEKLMKKLKKKYKEPGAICNKCTAKGLRGRGFPFDPAEDSLKGYYSELDSHYSHYLCDDCGQLFGIRSRVEKSEVPA